MANFFDQYKQQGQTQAPAEVAPTETAAAPTDPATQGEATKANFFDQYKQQGQTQAPQATEQAAPQSTFMDGVDAFNRQFARVAEGSIQLFAQKTGMKGVENAVDKVHAQGESDLAAAQTRSPIASTVGGVLGAVGSGTAYTALGAGAGMALGAAAPGVAAKAASSLSGVPQLAKDVVGMAAGSGALGYLNYADSPESRNSNALTAATIGGAMPVVAAAGKGIYNALTGNGSKVSGFLEQALRPQQAALKDLSYDVGTQVGGDAGAIKKAVASADALGVPLTPGQAIGGSLLRSKEGSLVTDQVGKRDVFNLHAQQTEAVKGNIKGAIDKMVPEGTQNAVQLRSQLYNDLQGVQVGDDVMNTIKNNPSLSVRLNKMNKAVDSNMAALPDNSFVKVDALKQELDDTLFKDTFQLVDPTKKLKGYEKDAIINAKQQLLDSMQPYSKYTEARDVSQRLIIQNRYAQLLDKKIPKAGNQGELGIDEMHSALFNTPDKIKYFLKDVEATGGDVNAVSDVIKVADQLKQSTLDKVLKNQQGSTLAGSLGGGSKSVVQRLVIDKLSKRYNDAFLKLTLSGSDWVNKVSDQVAKGAVSNPAEAVKNILVQAIGKGTERAISLSASEVANGKLDAHPAPQP